MLSVPGASLEVQKRRTQIVVSVEPCDVGGAYSMCDDVGRYQRLLVRRSLRAMQRRRHRNLNRQSRSQNHRVKLRYLASLPQSRRLYHCYWARCICVRHHTSYNLANDWMIVSKLHAHVRETLTMEPSSGNHGNLYSAVARLRSLLLLKTYEVVFCSLERLTIWAMLVRSVRASNNCARRVSARTLIARIQRSREVLDIDPVGTIR